MHKIRKKLQILSLFFLVIPFPGLMAQDSIAKLDSLILAIHKENYKGKRIKIGNLRTGTVYWFLQNNENMFAIELRKEFKTRNKFDSSITHHYYYKSDFLIKATCEKHYYLEGKPNSGSTHLYFEKNILVDQAYYKVAPAVDVAAIIREAYAELKKGYAYRNAK